MAFVWILSLAFFVGASSASDFHDIAGVNSTLAGVPSIVQVEFLQPWGVWQQKGAATILNNRYVLTAASLFSGPDYNPMYRRVRAGSNFLSSGGVINYVEKANNYPAGNYTNQPSDISVVRLAAVFQYTPFIQRAFIVAAGSTIPNGLILSQAGWGSRNISNALTVAPVMTVSTNQCGFNHTGFNSTILCGNLVQGYNISNADAGSPWIFSNVTIGVVSGLNFENSTWPGILSASITYYTNWILRTAV
ncbi:trypsin, alkaline C-like [Vanessa atalanta]|uniref:trypsin, alkaline C-like n=1 Tax=Vanessa atalanta TaxID=42275 RepID=UPI001FCD53B3|nr:trypsin, alkaline C-like [Vanessa atalanta]